MLAASRRLAAVICVGCNLLCVVASGQVDHPKLKLRTDRPLYFPAGVFDPSDLSVSNVEANRLTKYLNRTMSEPSLFDAVNRPGMSSYRLIRVGSFVRSVVVRLTIAGDGTANLAVKSGSSGSIVQKTLTVSSAEVSTFLNLVGGTHFWELPANEQTVPNSRTLNLDGAMWVLEGTTNGQYHIAIRRNPKPSSFTQVARYLAKNLANLGDEIISIPDRPQS